MTRFRTAVLVAMFGISLLACSGDEEQAASQSRNTTSSAQHQAQRAEAAQSQQNTEALPQEEPPTGDEQEETTEQAVEQPNRAPVADAGKDRTDGLMPSAVTLSAQGSSDPDGDHLTYQWAQISGIPVTLEQSSPTSPMASFQKPRSESTLVFEVTVTDSSGNSDSDQITVILQNHAPVANAGQDREVGRSELVILSAGESSDDDRHSLTYQWTQTSGEPIILSNPSGRTPTFTAPETLGTLAFALTVHDGFTASESDSVMIEVVNLLPIIAVLSPDTAPRGTRVTLDASESSDPEGGAVTFLWTQVASVSGAEVTLNNPTSATQSFMAPETSGTLRFRVEVSDPEGGSESEVVAVSITNSAPVSEAGFGQAVETGSWVQLDGRASRDPDGDRLTYSWTQTAGDEVQLNNAESASPTFTAPNRVQSLRFALTVDDGDKSHTDTVSITVKYEPVIANNQDSWNQWTPVFYRAREDTFTGNIRTDVRMLGQNRDLMVDVVCFENGSAALGFWLVDFERTELDSNSPDELEVMWRLDNGPVRTESLEVELIGEVPAVYFQQNPQGFNDDWPQVLGGGKLAVRIGYRGVQEEVFDLDALARTPVHGNLVNCGEY